MVGYQTEIEWIRSKAIAQEVRLGGHGGIRFAFVFGKGANESEDLGDVVGRGLADGGCHTSILGCDPRHMLHEECTATMKSAETNVFLRLDDVPRSSRTGIPGLVLSHALDLVWFVPRNAALNFHAVSIRVCANRKCKARQQFSAVQAPKRGAIRQSR